MSTTPGTVDPRRFDTGNTTVTQQKSLSLLRRRDSFPHPSGKHPLLHLLAPGVVYLAIRVFGILVLAAMSAANGKALTKTLGAWDGEWYLEIAQHGYEGVNPSMVDGFGHRFPETPMAFFPGYPLLIRLFALIPGVEATGAAIIVSLIAGVACAYGLARLGQQIGGSRGAALLYVALFAASPMSVVLSMAYSEALFCALAVWALVGVIERNWTLAGLCCALSGLVRPTAASLIAVVGLAALVAVVQRKDSWRPWLALALAPAGMVSYVGWVALQTGELGGYFTLQQRGWSSAFDGGVQTLDFMIHTLSADKSVLETLTVWIVLASIVLLVLCFRRHMPWPLLAFTVAVMALDLGSDGLMYSKVRLMLPAFPLLLPVAMGLAHRRKSTAVSTTVLLVCFGAWFGAYSLTAWSYAI